MTYPNHDLVSTLKGYAVLTNVGLVRVVVHECAGLAG